jgi:8-oxo-dGTP pyrophosphatase MutT (NUDIX family)
MSTKSVGVVVFSEDQKSVLLQKREDFRVWGIPSGRIENGETHEETGIRETQEEAGFLIQIERFVGEYWRPQLPSGGDMLYLYVGRVIGGRAEDHGWESVAVEWFATQQLPRRTLRVAREFIADALKGSIVPVKKTQLLPWWYINLLRVGLTLRSIRNRIRDHLSERTPRYLGAETYLKKRANRGNKAKFLAAMAKVADVEPPDERDRI